MKKERIDIFLFERGLVESRSLAQRLIMAGEIFVNGDRIDKPSQKISPDDEITILSGPKYVSRGGEKLEPALTQFGLAELHGKVCVDVGSSTGGFTDCLLQHGAEKVYAVDVGYGILHWKIRNNPKVVVMERTNARFIEKFPDPIDLVTVDASFISLKVLLPSIYQWLKPNGNLIALIKPQFEAGRKDAAKGSGVIRDHEIHQKVLFETLTNAYLTGFDIHNVILSPITGPKGNIEFLADLEKVIHHAIPSDEIEKIILTLFPNDELE